MPYTYQPSGANYCFYHEDGYPVCVGDGKKPSQQNNRKQKPHGVPILTKIKDKPNPVEEAQKKKLAKIRKKEYDRLYRAANRKIPSKESKGSLTQTIDMKRDKQKEAKKKLDKLKETNDKLTSVRAKKDDKEKALAIAKYESKWDNTDGAKTFKDKMDKVKKQKDSDQKKRQLEKLKEKEKDAEEKHKQMNTKSIKVIEADIKGLEKQEKKAYGIALIKKDKKIEEFKKDRSAVVIQKAVRQRIVENKAKKIIEEKEKEKQKEKKKLDDYVKNYYEPLGLLIETNKELIKNRGVSAVAISSYSYYSRDRFKKHVVKDAIKAIEKAIEKEPERAKKDADRLEREAERERKEAERKARIEQDKKDIEKAKEKRWERAKEEAKKSNGAAEKWIGVYMSDIKTEQNSVRKLKDLIATYEKYLRQKPDKIDKLNILAWTQGKHQYLGELSGEIKQIAGSFESGKEKVAKIDSRIRRWKEQIDTIKSIAPDKDEIDLPEIPDTETGRTKKEQISALKSIIADESGDLSKARQRVEAYTKATKKEGISKDTELKYLRKLKKYKDLLKAKEKSKKEKLEEIEKLKSK